jgi:hypothetical protein
MGGIMSDLFINGERIPIEVHTNLDAKYQWQFPSTFYAIPRIGDYIVCQDGDQDRNLKVCARYFQINGSIKIEVTGQSYHS